MKDQNLNQWLESLEKKPMTANDDLQLDELLNSPQQMAIKKAVAGLEEDTVSLQWRSKLNERLAAVAPIKRKINYFMIGARAFAGAGVACLALMVWMAKKPTVNTAQPVADQSSTLAVALLTEHRESVASSEIAGAGVIDGDQETKTESNPSRSVNESDLESL